MSETDIIKTFDTYLRSDTIKTLKNNKDIYRRYIYTKEQSDFFSFWKSSSFNNLDYTISGEFIFATTDDVDIDTLCQQITYMVRREKYTNGYVATHLDSFKLLISLLNKKIA